MIEQGHGYCLVSSRDGLACGQGLDDQVWSLALHDAWCCLNHEAALMHPPSGEQLQVSFRGLGAHLAWLADVHLLLMAAHLSGTLRAGTVPSSSGPHAPCLHQVSECQAAWICCLGVECRRLLLHELLAHALPDESATMLMQILLRLRQLGAELHTLSVRHQKALWLQELVCWCC